MFIRNVLSVRMLSEGNPAPPPPPPTPSSSGTTD
jgi:hypothetical protein